MESKNKSTKPDAERKTSDCGYQRWGGGGGQGAWSFEMVQRDKVPVIQSKYKDVMHSTMTIINTPCCVICRKVKRANPKSSHHHQGKCKELVTPGVLS